MQTDRISHYWDVGKCACKNKLHQQILMPKLALDEDNSSLKDEKYLIDFLETQDLAMKENVPETSHVCMYVMQKKRTIN